jgi:putative transposase
MDWQAEQAQDHLIKSGIITVIVQDQGSIHTSKLVKERHNYYWASKGLYLFSLPSYCSEMNRIENEWQRLKEDELGGRMFSDEYELAIAVMEGVKDRYKQDCYEVKRYYFHQE